MFKKPKKFYITTPIYYVNDRPHLGHAYTTIAADVLKRYRVLRSDRVFLLTGTDEHGAKIEAAAEKKGQTPQQLCNENAEIFKETWKGLNVSYDNFIRTTDNRHIKTVKKILEILHKKGFIYKGTYEGLYCRGCEQYKTDSDLIDGKCSEHKIEPELIKEESYLFKLSQFQDELIKKIENNEFEIAPEERKNEALNFLRQGLKDISISRQKVKWGIPLPFDKNFTAYVWVDAFLNYLTGLNWEGNPQKLPEFWPSDLQLMGKDILRVHATIWPALLLSLGIPLPKKIFVHGYFTLNGQKMSKSLGNVIWPDEMVKKFGVDATRYLLLTACHFGQDGDISWEKLTEKYNADLANGVGNLINRVLTLIEKKFDGKIPKSSKSEPDLLIEKINNYDKLLTDLKIDQVLKEIMSICSDLDNRIDKEKIYQADSLILSDALYIFAETIRIWAWLISPFLPETADKIFEQLGLDPKKEKKKKFEDAIKWGGLKPGTKIKKGKPLFPRI